MGMYLLSLTVARKSDCFVPLLFIPLLKCPTEGSHFIFLHPYSHSLLQQVQSELCLSPPTTYIYQYILSAAYSLTLMMKAEESLKHQYIVSRLYSITSQKTIFIVEAFSFHRTKATSLPKSAKPFRMRRYT